MAADAARSTSRARRARTRASGFTLDVAFDAPPGITVLFGPSGSGKSTTLAAIAGLVRPPRGRIALGDEVWFDADAQASTSPCTSAASRSSSSRSRSSRT